MIMALLVICCAGLAAVATWLTATNGYWGWSIVWGILSAFCTILAINEVMNWLYGPRHTKRGAKMGGGEDEG